MRSSVSPAATHSCACPNPDLAATRAIKHADGELSPTAKATDENLTSEDWGAIMEVCDKASSDPNGPKEAVQSLIKRLAHRNANVQLYTLEVR